MKARLFGPIALMMLPTIAFAADAGSGPTKGATSTNDAGSGPTPGAKPGTGSADSTPASSGQATKSAADNECAEVISCGTKDGKAKQYPTPCDAEKDGATDVRARQGSSCTAEK